MRVYFDGSRAVYRISLSFTGPQINWCRLIDKVSFKTIVDLLTYFRAFEQIFEHINCPLLDLILEPRKPRSEDWQGVLLVSAIFCCFYFQTMAIDFGGTGILNYGPSSLLY